MASLGQYFLLIARTFPIHVEARKLTSQEQEFHEIVHAKLWDAKETISITDSFNNAAFLNTDDEALLLKKRNAYALHRIFQGGPGFQIKGGERPWYDFALDKIKTGQANSLSDLQGP